MTLAFTHDSLPQRVILQTGAAPRHLREEISRLGAQRVMLIAGEAERELADRVVGDLDLALRWDEVVQHVPVTLAERARSAAESAGVDLVVSIGGGSTTGLAKAVALTTGLPVVAVPTTYAGSEATAMWGMTDDHTKRTGIDPVVLPRTVIYDSELSRTLPLGLSVSSGLNGVAHGVDNLWAPGTDPIVVALSLEAVRALSSGLRAVVAAPDDVDGRDRCLYGAYLSARAFATAGSGLHHKICHVLGGTFDLPHAATHAVVVAYSLAHNAHAVPPDLAARLASALGREPAPGEDGATAAVAALEQLRRDTDAPGSLAEVGLTEQDLPEATERIVAAVPASNPRPVTPESIHALLRAALRGTDPRSLL
ncbi:maleylacetate reductase [Ornithinimicrobium sp. W1665]|uniref:maleylacetate reductase n=1 Tax=Ornithinimicrobium sp. W1665 TaxID=3416666 RepID=UPI003CFA5831